VLTRPGRLCVVLAGLVGVWGWPVAGFLVYALLSNWSPWDWLWWCAALMVLEAVLLQWRLTMALWPILRGRHRR
jgi:hypothetical protein